MPNGTGTGSDTGTGRYDAQGRVRAAGGVVWRRRDDDGAEVLLVHRPHYDDWTFPKGKRDDGETDEQAAVREVAEEAGLRCVLGFELPEAHYVDRNGRNKVVRYWVMEPVAGAPGDASAQNEVDAVRWLDPEGAAALLTYERDVEVLDGWRRALRA